MGLALLRRSWPRGHTDRPPVLHDPFLALLPVLDTAATVLFDEAPDEHLGSDLGLFRGPPEVSGEADVGDSVAVVDSSGRLNRLHRHGGSRFLFGSVAVR